MPQRDFTPFLLFGAFVLLITNPRLFVVAAILYLLVRWLTARGRKSTGQTGQPGAISALQRQFDEFFGQRPKVVTVRPQPPRQTLSFSQFSMSSTQLLKASIGFVTALLVIFVIIDGFVDVKPGYAAVKYDRGRGVLAEPLEEGLHLKIPFWQEVTKFQTRKQEFTMAGEYEGVADEDAVRGRSKDGQDVVIDVTVTYQVAAADTPELRKQFRDEEGYQKTIMRPAARSVVYDSIGKFNALELIAEKRSDFNNQIADNLRKIYAQNRIDLQEVFIRKITFSEGFASAIEEKQIAEQRIKTAQNRKLEAEELKLKTIIEAEAEAEAIRLKGESLRQNPEVIQLQFVEKMAPQINWGILPDGALPLIDLKSLQQGRQ